MREPQVLKASAVVLGGRSVTTPAKDGRWIPARFHTWQKRRWFVRTRLAWAVFRGRYDALDWEDEGAE